MRLLRSTSYQILLVPEVLLLFGKELIDMFEELNITSLIVEREGKIIDQYDKQPDTHESLQPINSCTKSFSSAIVGVCVDQGLIKNIHQPIKGLLPDDKYLLKYPLFGELNIYQLLTMSTGMKWHEPDDWNIFGNRGARQDVMDYILSKGMDPSEVTRMVYNSGSSHLLAYLVKSLTGQSVEAFARNFLFEPLDIQDYRWPEKQEVHFGSHGMWMIASDLHKLGVLFLNKGRYGGKQVLSEQWIGESTRTHFTCERPIGDYGYHWWTTKARREDGVEVHVYFAFGYGGQAVFVIEDLDMVMTLLRKPGKDGLVSIQFMKDYIMGIKKTVH